MCGVGGGERSGFQIAGSMTGVLQIGATVNDGESYALNQLAEWASSPVSAAVDSKVAIKRCGKPDIHKQMPGIWTAMPIQRDRLRISLTKSHLTKEEHGQRFGTSKAWVWAAFVNSGPLRSSTSANTHTHIANGKRYISK